MSLSKLTPLRALARTSRIPIPARPGIVQRRAMQKRGYAAGGQTPKEPADFDKPKNNNMPVMVAIAITIPALAWFFYGRTTPPQRTGGTRGEHGDASAGANVNEEGSRSVPAVQPEGKASKMTNPKAVLPDEQRMESEKAEKSNTLTGTSTGGKSSK